MVNAPTANTVAAAEHGIALLCAMARNVSQVSRSEVHTERMGARVCISLSPRVLLCARAQVCCATAEQQGAVECGRVWGYLLAISVLPEHKSRCQEWDDCAHSGADGRRGKGIRPAYYLATAGRRIRA